MGLNLMTDTLLCLVLVGVIALGWVLYRLMQRTFAKVGAMERNVLRFTASSNQRFERISRSVEDSGQAVGLCSDRITQVASSFDASVGTVTREVQQLRVALEPAIELHAVATATVGGAAVRVSQAAANMSENSDVIGASAACVASVFSVSLMIALLMKAFDVLSFIFTKLPVLEGLDKDKVKAKEKEEGGFMRWWRGLSRRQLLGYFSLAVVIFWCSQPHIVAWALHKARGMLNRLMKMKLVTSVIGPVDSQDIKDAVSDIEAATDIKIQDDDKKKTEKKKTRKKKNSATVALEQSAPQRQKENAESKHAKILPENDLVMHDETSPIPTINDNKEEAPVGWCLLCADAGKVRRMTAPVATVHYNRDHRDSLSKPVMVITGPTQKRNDGVVLLNIAEITSEGAAVLQQNMESYLKVARSALDLKDDDDQWLLRMDCPVLPPFHCWRKGVVHVGGIGCDCFAFMGLKDSKTNICGACGVQPQFWKTHKQSVEHISAVTSFRLANAPLFTQGGEEDLEAARLADIAKSAGRSPAINAQGFIEPDIANLGHITVDKIEKMSIAECLRNPWVIAGMFVLVILAIVWLKKSEKKDDEQEEKKEEPKLEADGKRRHRDKRRFDTSLFELYTDSWLKSKKREPGDKMPYDFFDPFSGMWDTRYFTYIDDESFGDMMATSAAQFEHFWEEFHNAGPTGHDDYVSVGGGIESDNKIHIDHVKGMPEKTPFYVVVERTTKDGSVQTHFLSVGGTMEVIKFPARVDEVKDFFKSNLDRARSNIPQMEAGMSFGEAAIQGAGLAFGSNLVCVILDLFMLRKAPVRHLEAKQKSIGFCHAERNKRGCLRKGKCPFVHEGAEEYFSKIPCNNIRCAKVMQQDCRMVHSTAQKQGKWARKPESMVKDGGYIKESDFEEIKGAFGSVEYSYKDSKGEIRNMRAQCYHARDRMQLMFHNHEIPTLISATVTFPRVGVVRKLTEKEIESVRNKDGKEAKFNAEGCLSQLFAIHPKSEVFIPQVRIGPQPNIGAPLWGWSMGNKTEEEFYFSPGKVDDVKDGILYHSVQTDCGNCGMAIMQGKYVVATHLLGGVQPGKQNEALLVQHFR
jgi:hypothetical protein